MPMNPQMGAAQMAGGGMPPQQMPPQAGGQPPVTAVAQNSAVTTGIQEVLAALKKIMPQAVDQRGYVDMNKLITLWPQFSNVPFQVVMQILQQSPELLNEIISQFGLAGIIVQGKVISADELAQLGGRGAA
ncbi:MAG: hypothetical protein WC750_05980 [Patescibacteria group bacterium]|jgi:hypothetical protein